MKDDWEMFEKNDIINDLYDHKTNKFEDEFKVLFKDSKFQKDEPYTLINKENEIVLCKNELYNELKSGKYKITIEEFFKDEESDKCYYINKEKMSEEHLKNLFELDKNNEDIRIDNQNEEEMDKLYKKVIMKHPRKVINEKQFKKYSFFSWTGFFCFKKGQLCYKDEFISLGFGISSYFKTLKLFILFFFIISCINLIGVAHYSKYKYEQNSLLGTTLGNTKTANYTKMFVSKIDLINNETIELSMNCLNKSIGKFIFGIKIDDEIFDEQYLVEESELNLPNSTTVKEYISHYDLNKLSEKMNECFDINECTKEINVNETFDRFNNYSYLLYYECIDTSLFPENTSKNELKNITQGITITTLILLFILYYFYKYSIYADYYEYNRDKIFINNYTLVLRKLKFSNENYNKEISDLIKHFNNIISKDFKKDDIDIAIDSIDLGDVGINKKSLFGNKNENLNVFDISISTVNEKKIESINNIKYLKDNIKNIKLNNDTISKKFKNSIHKSFDSISKFIKNEKNKSLENPLLDEDDNSEKNSDINNSLSEEQEEKIKNRTLKIKELIVNISSNIKRIHLETQKKNYIDIYITFRNPFISKFIYKAYHKSKIHRFFIYLTCRCFKIRKYYYKKQWLEFKYSNNAPNNIQWENCYISPKIKLKKRLSSYLVSFFIIIITVLIIVFLKGFQNSMIISMAITQVILLVNIISSILLAMLTKSERLSTLTKNISSNIKKIFWLNFLISAIFINIKCKFTYKPLFEYAEVIQCSIMCLIFATFTSHGSPIFFYCWALFKRFLDSKFTNGKTTKLNTKSEYENLYTGDEFPIGQRYATILINLSICFIYGTYCPIIYVFFTTFLITTFLVDKYLIINYYKKPPYYDNYLSKKFKNFFILEIFLFVYGTIFQLSNPYLFNYYQNDSLLTLEDEYKSYYIYNPISAIYKLIGKYSDVPITTFYLSNLIFPYLILFLILFIIPMILLEIFQLCVNKAQSHYKEFLNIDIGDTYGINELKKYYEVKKLELFSLLVNIKKNNEKKFEDYSDLINNYKYTIDYIRDNISFRIKQKNKINRKFISVELSGVSNNNENSNLLTINENNQKENDRLLIGDPSYNLTFIPNYELYYYFDLLYSI